jgi:cytochrome c-type biogenesis protein CcmE
MFEQIDDPEIMGKKTWKERITEGIIIIAVASVVIGIILYALEKG